MKSLTNNQEPLSALSAPAGYAIWTKEPPKKSGYYWHRDAHGTIRILEWDEGEQCAMQCGSDIMWTYENWGGDLNDTDWWTDEVTFPHNGRSEPRCRRRAHANTFNP